MLYFDTSFLAPLILEEATSTKIEAFFAKLPVGSFTSATGPASSSPASSRAKSEWADLQSPMRCWPLASSTK